MTTIYLDTEGNQLISRNGDMAILTADEHIATLEPLQALLAAASPINLFAYYWQTGAVVPVGTVLEPDWII